MVRCFPKANIVQLFPAPGGALRAVMCVCVCVTSRQKGPSCFLPGGGLGGGGGQIPLQLWGWAPSCSSEDPDPVAFFQCDVTLDEQSKRADEMLRL